MHNAGYKSALARRACRYSDARPPRKTDGVPLESELPPHMRGKGLVEVAMQEADGITPAYAGKRQAPRCRPAFRRDHPRVCGEKPEGRLCLNLILGSPPHMRGKVRDVTISNCNFRITPAHAGKSYWPTQKYGTSGDHPRVCGEKRLIALVLRAVLGSPPRMRGKAEVRHERDQEPGITPAYAGKNFARTR